MRDSDSRYSPIHNEDQLGVYDLRGVLAVMMGEKKKSELAP